MSEYDLLFSDSGEVRWTPYFMYFHPASYRSNVVNTDDYGFRFSLCEAGTISPLHLDGSDSISILAGGSTVFGIGASQDGHTLSSQLNRNSPRSEKWINMGGRSFNSTQELILMSLNLHLFQGRPVEDIVLFSGFNNLGLARVPQTKDMPHGAFFNCSKYFEKLRSSNEILSNRTLQKMMDLLSGRKSKQTPPASSYLDLTQQIHRASELTLQHLHLWKIIADFLGAKLTFMLQPLATWVREIGAKNEEALFLELDKQNSFVEVYGDILTQEAMLMYAKSLEEGANSLSVRFVNVSAILSEQSTPDQWLFVDRIHFTDEGHQIVSKIIQDSI